MDWKNEQLPDDLLARYVAGDTTDDEAAQVKAWLVANTHPQGAAEELLRYHRIWEEASALKPPSNVNTDAAWQKVKAKTEGKTKRQEIRDRSGAAHAAEERRQQKGEKRRKNQKATSYILHHTSPYIRMAASVLLVVGLGWLGYIFLNQTPPKTPLAKVLESKNQTIEHLLPDGTKVFLNQNTQLTLAPDFNESARQVKLQGEAFFEVKRNEHKPFVINANGAEIKVLGTAFNVKAYGPTVSVMVTSGKVQFSKKNTQTLLVKNEAAVVQADTIIRLNTLNLNSLAYRTRVFVFEKTALQNVVASLREGYQADIQLRHSRLANCRLTARFERENLDNTLAVIAETLHLKVIKEGDQIILDGDGCQ